MDIPTVDGHIRFNALIELINSSKALGKLIGDEIIV